MREVVVSAAAVLSPLGNSLAEFQRGLFGGTSGIHAVRGLPVPFLGEVPTFSTPGFVTSKSQHARAAGFLLEQLSPNIDDGLPIDAILSGHRDPSEISVALTALQQNKELDFSELVNESPLEIADSFLRAQKSIAVREDRQIWLCNACNTGNALVGAALHQIRAGRWDRALILNVEMDPDFTHLMAFHLLGALTTEAASPETASSPFSVARAGFVKASGGVAFLVEEHSLAKRRNASILAKVRGYGTAADAYRMVESSPEARGPALAMQRALEDARLTVDDIDCVSAHATSTRGGDMRELSAIENVFAERSKTLPVTALKSQTGHATFASGGLEALAAMISLREQRIAAIRNLEETGPTSVVDLVRGMARPAPLRTILCNNIGFGGQSASLILEAESSS